MASPDEMSIVEYFGGDGGHRCGYCKNESGFVAPGMWAHSLTVKDLQELTDRGWRRSGKYCYKPTNNEMCCPLYIIRCDAPNFIISKSQKKVLKKMAAFLKNEHKEQNDSSPQEKQQTTPSTSVGPSKEVSEIKEESSTLEQTTAATPTLDKDIISVPKVVRFGTGPDPSKPRARKAKDIRRERKLLKTSERQSQIEDTPMQEEVVPLDTPTQEKATPTQEMTIPTQRGAIKGPPIQERKSLESHFEEVWSIQNPTHKLTIRLVQSHPPSKEFRDTLKDSYEVYRKYQIAIHKDPPSKCTFEQYKRFLVDSPLVSVPGPDDWGCGFGSYHQQYLLDGKIIMVGVVDILPNCLSSKYLYYDTDYDFLKLGVFSALNEMALVRKLHLANPEFRYYCMGYYVHSCQKMKYKGDYYPSYLLCPVTNQYVPIETCKPKLDVTKYARFNEEARPVAPGDVDSSLVLYHHQAMPFGVLRVLEEREGVVRKFEDKVREYTELVGPIVSQRSLLFLA